MDIEFIDGVSGKDIPRQGTLPAIPFTHLPSFTPPTWSPYGDHWDLLWIGHCGMHFPFEDHPTIPKGHVIRLGDDTVAPKKDLWTINIPFTLKEQYPEHTRAYHHVQEGVCSLGRAVPELQANQDFFASFLRGDVTPWKHKDYLLAAYLTLLDPENRNLGLLEVASNFADNVNRLKQKHSRIQLMPESRTLTVFWLYHVKLGIHAMSMFWNCDAYLGQFKRIFHFTPELMNEKLPESYYSPDILRSEYAEKFWMLPNLRELLEPHRYLNADFRREFVKKSEGDPDQLLRFAFEVVQRYLRPGETRRRSWFINLAFAVLQKQIIRLRSMKLSVPQYSETHAYFNLQMVHAALSQLLVVGKAKEVQEMSYALFRETFCISPTAWTTHYSPKLWDSLKARAAFVPPDLKPLPDTIHLPHLKAEPKEDVEIRNESFRKAGLIPELPSLETLDFHQAVLLEEAKSIKFSLTPSEVTTHAHLLRYIHTHIDLASRTLPPDDIPSLAAQHLADLTASSPLPSAHLSFYIDLVLNNLKLHPNLDYHPPIPNIPFKPSYTDPKTKKFIRFHNCSCRKGDDDEVTLAGGDETADKDFEEVGDEWEILSHDTLQ
ncbi:hypothetical protein N0V88_001553 [Collariella sp. IMI 366227]|nr:hypothetical protein N0V88_001553 [Collariella sp. IMI 366227]